MEGTTFSLHSTARPEGMADVPGVCELQRHQERKRYDI